MPASQTGQNKNGYRERLADAFLQQLAAYNRGYPLAAVEVSPSSISAVQSEMPPAVAYRRPRNEKGQSAGPRYMPEIEAGSWSSTGWWLWLIDDGACA